MQTTSHLLAKNAHTYAPHVRPLVLALLASADTFSAALTDALLQPTPPILPIQPTQLTSRIA